MQPLVHILFIEFSPIFSSLCVIKKRQQHQTIEALLKDDVVEIPSSKKF